MKGMLNLLQISPYLWQKNTRYQFIMGALFSILMILISVYDGLGVRNVAFEVVILIYGVGFFFYEVLQLFLMRKNYFHSIWNCADFSYFILVIVTMITRF